MPQVIQRNCDTCGNPLEPTLAALGMFNHPTCDEVPQDLELVAPPIDEIAAPVPAAVVTPFTPMGNAGAVPEPLVAKAVKDELTTILLWSEAHRPRSKQINIGPSEIGVACDRRLAYRVMGLTGPNEGMADPWPAFVGSSIHDRIEEAIRAYMAAHPNALPWSIEEWVEADPLIKGRADLNRKNLLVDVKSGGKDKMDEVKKHGPQLGYRVQQMLYAKGLRDKGKMIEYICLAFVPRSGWLKDMYVWAEPYDHDMALRYIARPYELARLLAELGVRENPHRWEQIPATPTYECQYCPMWDRYVPMELGATDKSCPGYQGGKK